MCWDEMLHAFYTTTHKLLYDLGAQKKKSALEETILANVLCPQLVKHMRVSL